MRRAIVATIVYALKLRVMVCRAASCLMACDKLSSPPLVIFRCLIVRVNERSYSCHHSLPDELKSDGVESCQMPEAL